MKSRSLAVLALFAFAGLAKAESNFGECIEWIVADSERVIVGKIIETDNTGRHEIVTVAVSKTIRGKHEAKIQFVIRVAGGYRPGQGWMKTNLPMLFCLVTPAQIKDNKDLPDTKLVLRHGPNDQCAVLLGKTDQRSMDVFTRDYGELTDPAAILKHVEAYAKTIPADWKKKHVIVDLHPETPAYKKLYAGSSVSFTLPADAILESQGRRWCKSENVNERSHGVRALSAFKTEENIKILKGLLADPAYSTGSGMRSYYIRAQAYEVLREFGVNVERPVLLELAK